MRVACIIVGALLMMPAWVQAHTHLEYSTPAASSTVVAPKQIVLGFAHPVRITALFIQSEGSDQLQKLAPLPSEVSATITVSAPQLKAGKYVVVWRAAGDDGHVMSSSIHFTVSAP